MGRNYKRRKFGNTNVNTSREVECPLGSALYSYRAKSTANRLERMQNIKCKDFYTGELKDPVGDAPVNILGNTKDNVGMLAQDDAKHECGFIGGFRFAGESGVWDNDGKYSYVHEPIILDKNGGWGCFDPVIGNDTEKSKWLGGFTGMTWWNEKDKHGDSSPYHSDQHCEQKNFITKIRAYTGNTHQNNIEGIHYECKDFNPWYKYELEGGDDYWKATCLGEPNHGAVKNQECEHFRTVMEENDQRIAEWIQKVPRGEIHGVHRKWRDSACAIYGRDRSKVTQACNNYYRQYVDECRELAVGGPERVALIAAGTKLIQVKNGNEELKDTDWTINSWKSHTTSRNSIEVASFEVFILKPVLGGKYVIRTWNDKLLQKRGRRVAPKFLSESDPSCQFEIVKDPDDPQKFNFKLDNEYLVWFDGGGELELKSQAEIDALSLTSYTAAESGNKSFTIEHIDSLAEGTKFDRNHIYEDCKNFCNSDSLTPDQRKAYNCDVYMQERCEAFVKAGRHKKDGVDKFDETVSIVDQVTDEGLMCGCFIDDNDEDFNDWFHEKTNGTLKRYPYCSPFCRRTGAYIPQVYDQACHVNYLDCSIDFNGDTLVKDSNVYNDCQINDGGTANPDPPEPPTESDDDDLQNIQPPSNVGEDVKNTEEEEEKDDKKKTSAKNIIILLLVLIAFGALGVAFLSK